MISTQYELTDEGKRSLLRELSWELTDAKIAELVAEYTDRLTTDRHGEYVIRIVGADVLMCATKIYDLWIEAHHVDKVLVNEEDGNE